MKKTALFLAGLVSFILFSPSLYAAEGAIVKPSTASHLTQDELTRQAIRDQVTVLRQQRFEKMPYLGKDFIRTVIDEKEVKNKNQFVSGGKKNLAEIIDRSIFVSSRARAADAKTALSKRKIFAAIRELFPQVNTQYIEKSGTLSPKNWYNSRSYRWAFRQPVFRGGALWNTLLKEKAGLEAAKREYDQVVSDLVNDVSAAYFEYNRAMEVIYDQQTALEKVKRFVDISEQKWKQELISEIEHLNSQSLYSQMQYDYESAKQELELARLELQKFLDLSLDDELNVREMYNVPDLVKEENISGEPADMEEPHAPEGNQGGMKDGTEIPNLEVLVDLAYQNRPELRVESAKLNAARYEEKVKWGEMMPHADVVMEFGRLGEAYNIISVDPKLRQEFRCFFELTWNALGNKASYNFEHNETAPSVTQFDAANGTLSKSNTFKAGILDGLKEMVDIKQAEVEKLDQVVELEKAEKEVIHDVKEAYFDYQRSSIQVKSALKRAEYRERLVTLSLHRLDTNEIQISEYLQAEIDLLRERTDLHKALKEFFTAKAKLNRAIGMREFLPVEESYGKSKSVTGIQQTKTAKKESAE